MYLNTFHIKILTSLCIIILNTEIDREMKNIIRSIWIIGISVLVLTSMVFVDRLITEKEKEGIIKIRQEEKLVRDIYKSFHETWDDPFFEQVMECEQIHMDRMKMLIDNFNLEDPVTEETPGKFTDKDFRDIYFIYTEIGKSSFLAALKTGAELEELDISDLQEALDNSEDALINQVYQNLQRASRNHLRAFVARLNKLGGSYSPKFIGNEQYNDIINSPMERGGQNMGRGLRMMNPQNKKGNCIF